MPTDDETRDAPAPGPAHTHAADGPTPSLPPNGLLTRTASDIDALSGAATPNAAPVVSGYELLGELGEGGMGVVYRAREVAFDRDVAVKVLRAKYAPDSPTGRRFLDEARITGQLQHPAIPPVHQIGTLPDGRPFLAMKLIKGETLADRLASADPAARLRLVPAFAQVCQALAYAHSRKVIHRDLKPQNVMVGAFGEVLVMDWGLAKVLTDAPSVEATEPDAGEGTEVRTGREPDLATQAGAVLGTPAYMAPEQAAGEIDQVDERADVFGLGAMLCAALTGKPPYQGPSTDAVRIRAIRGELADAFARLDGCGADPELIALCKRCLATDRDARPRHAGEVAKAVAAHLAAVEERARQAELDRVRSEERRKQRRVQWLLAGAVLLLLAVAATGATVARLWQDAEAAKAEAETQRDTADAAKTDALNQKQIADGAKDEALAQKGIADTARGTAEKAQKAESEARQAVEREREKLAAVEYGRTMQVAHQAFRDNDTATMRALLDSTKPELRGWEWRYLDRLSDPSLLIFKGHTDVVKSASFSPDGALIVTAGAASDHTARVWDAKTGKELLVLKHTGPVFAASFSPDGSRIVTAGSTTKTARVWDAKTGEELLVIKPSWMVFAASFSPDGSCILTGGGLTAQVWDAETGQERLTLNGHTAGVNTAAWSSDGARIVTASNDGTARVWDAKTGAEVLSIVPPTRSRGTKGVTLASFSPDGSRVFTANLEDGLRVWDAKTGKELFTIASQTGVVKAASFSPDGTRLVTAGSDLWGSVTIWVWDVKTGTQVLALIGHAKGVQAAAWSPDGARIVTASFDKTARVWDATTGKEAVSLQSNKGWSPRGAFSPDGSRVVTARHDKTARVWDATTGQELLILHHALTVNAASFSPDGSRILTASDDRTARVWDAKTGQELFALEGHAGAVRAALFSPDGSRILTASDGETVRVWDANTGTQVLALNGQKGMLFGASFSPDGARILITSYHWKARVWDARTGTEVFALKGPAGPTSSASFSPDGSRIAISLFEERSVARVWDLQSGKEVLALNGRMRDGLMPGEGKPFSPDGSRVMTWGPVDKTLRVWDAQTGAEVLVLKGHTGMVNMATYSPDGSRILTASLDGTARLWDAQTGAEVLALKGHSGGVTQATFSPDGSRILTADLRGITRVWDARPLRDGHQTDSLPLAPMPRTK